MLMICESDTQLAAICEAARQQLRYEDRARFLQIIAGELATAISATAPSTARSAPRFGRSAGIRCHDEHEKASLVAKMKAARDRKIAAGEKCGGRRSHIEMQPDVVALAKKLRRKRASLREISAALAKAGFVKRERCALRGGVRPQHAGAVICQQRGNVQFWNTLFPDVFRRIVALRPESCLGSPRAAWTPAICDGNG